MEELLVQLGAPSALIEALHIGLLGRLLLAALLGGLIGLEREISGKPAGLRTNLLICVGATLLMELSVGVAAAANEANAAQGVPFRADPSRIAAQIVSGIGFLGAGTIMQARGSVTGLTTAATIWVVAAIGMAVGSRAYVEAVGCAALVGVALVMLGRLEGVVIRQRRTQRYLLTLESDPNLLEIVDAAFRDAGLIVQSEVVELDGEWYQASFDVAGPQGAHQRASRAFVSRPGIRKFTRIAST